MQVNEAFAAQFLSVEKELGLDRERTNVNGGAIALGHPLAASGSRITAHLVHEMRWRNVHYSIGSACIGGGQVIYIAAGENGLRSLPCTVHHALYNIMYSEVYYYRLSCCTPSLFCVNINL